MSSILISFLQYLTSLLLINFIKIFNLSFREVFLIEKLFGFKSENIHLADADKNILCFIFFRHKVGKTTVCVSIITSYSFLIGLGLINSINGLTPIFKLSTISSIKLLIKG